MKKKLNIGLIGYGFMGRAHSNAYRKVNQFFDLDYQPVLKAVCARKEDKVKAFAKKWGYESYETDWRKLIARDDKRNPLVSVRKWSDEAVERLFRVPIGFMRQRTQARAEALVAERNADRVELDLVEAGLDQGRQEMEKFIEAQAAESAAPKATDRPAAAPAGKCPWHSAATDIVRRPELADEAREGLYLNEVGLMSALEAKRKEQ